MKIFGIDPGSERTGYGCVETDGARHRIVLCGAITTSARASFPAKLLTIHSRLAALLAECRPDCAAIESLFHAVNVRTALKLGHARGVAMLAAVRTQGKHKPETEKAAQGDKRNDGGGRDAFQHEIGNNQDVERHSERERDHCRQESCGGTVRGRRKRARRGSEIAPDPDRRTCFQCRRNRQAGP